MVRHILLIEFRPDINNDDIDNIKKSFIEIKNRICGIISVEWGLNNSPENKNKNYGYCVVMTFEDNEARDNYLPHPEHEKLKKIFSPLLKDIIVFDYKTN